jgi:hypothetical protein
LASPSSVLFATSLVPFLAVRSHLDYPDIGTRGRKKRDICVVAKLGSNFPSDICINTCIWRDDPSESTIVEM